MKLNAKTLMYAPLIAVVTFSQSSCKKNNNEQNVSQVEFTNKSVTPPLVKILSGFNDVSVYSVIGSDDDITASPGYVFGGSADGAGLLKNADGSFTYLVNHEDNFAVSRITFDPTLKPIKGEYILNSTGGLWRLCSATLATPEEHGFGPLYLTCGESGEESRVHGVDPKAVIFNPAESKELSALGRWNAENAVPLNKNAFPGKTVIVIGDDDSNTEGGQVVLYISDRVGDLTGGSVYVMRRTNNNIKERDMVEGTSYDVEFVKIDNAASLTGRQVNLATASLNAIRFGRVEDIDYRKGSAANNRELYFTVTGQNNTGINADNSRSKYGRVYKLNLNDTDPTKGKLEVILDGDNRTGIAAAFQNPDNIVVTQNYVYVQEDPNSGYNDQTHDAYIYQYDIATKKLKPVFELDHRRTASDAAKYNVAGSSSGYPVPSGTPGTSSGFGAWEYGAMIDVSDQLGSPNTFLLCIQPHTWVGDRYKNADKGTIRTSESQASQVVLIKGLPK
jgi:hypothetical protein